MQHELSQTKHYPHRTSLLFLTEKSPCHNTSTEPEPIPHIDHDVDSVVSSKGETEDEYTLSAFGDMSLGEIIVPLLPSPAHLNRGVLQPRVPQPRLRLKVRRPPMPKRRMSYTYVPDPLPHSKDIDYDERWPGSPRPVKNIPSLHQHQPLVYPLPSDYPATRPQGNRSSKNSGTSLEKFVDELLPLSPSIRLSPPGSPASQAVSLPHDTREQKHGAGKASSDALATLPQSPLVPAPMPLKEKPWRTRLPPRPPIPKWDI